MGPPRIPRGVRVSARPKGRNWARKQGSHRLTAGLGGLFEREGVERLRQTGLPAGESAPFDRAAALVERLRAAISAAKY